MNGLMISPTSISRPNFDIQAPNVSRMPRAYMSSNYELVRRVKSEWDNAWKAREYEFAQIIECWKMYFAAIGEQWDEEARRYKIERHLRVAQYNIIRDKVRTMTGMLASDEYDGRFDPVTGKRNSGIEAVEFAYDCDKELLDYMNEYWQVILDGCVHVGTMEIRVTDEKDWRGNIQFKRAIPGRWIMSPYWKSNSIYDCKKAWKQGNLTATEIVALNPAMKKNPRVDVALQKEKKMGMDYSRPNLDEYDSPTPTFLDMYHVIEEHWIEEVRKKRIIGRTDDGRWIPFPVTEDNETLEQFAIQNGINDWQNGAQLVPYVDRIAHIERICTDLCPTDPLASGKPDIQVKCIPVCQFTFDRDFSGRNQGMVNDLLDPQKDINYAKSKRQELMASALGGAILYDRTRIPDEGDQQDFETNSNDPTRAFGLDGPPVNFMSRIADKQPSQELIRESEEPFSIIDRISGVSAAMSSRTQGASEPASLFSMKLKVNKVGTLPMDKRIKMLRVWMYESYFLQAQITYAGDERVFTSQDGNKEVTFNERLPDGSIANKVDELPLCSVTITESEGSLSRQLRDRAEITAMLEAVPKDYREPIAIMIGEAFKTMDLSGDKKEAVQQALKIEIAKARIASMTEIAKMISEGKGAEAKGLQAELMGIQLEQQLRQILNPVMNPMQPQGAPRMVTPPPAAARPRPPAPGMLPGPAGPGPAARPPMAAPQTMMNQ